MRQFKEAIILGSGPIKYIIHSKDVKAVYATPGMACSTITETIKRHWVENERDSAIISLVERWLEMDQDGRLVFGPEVNLANHDNALSHIICHEYEDCTRLAEVVVTNRLSNYYRIGVHSF